MSLALGVVHGEKIDGWFYSSITDLLTADYLPELEVVNVRSGPALSVGRNLLVSTFLEYAKSDVLLMLDSDMVFTPQTIAQMWQYFQTLHVNNGPDALVLGGLAFIASAATDKQPGFIQPTLWVCDEAGDYAAVTEYPSDTLIDVDATGAACLMVHRTVFEKFDGWFDTDGKLGEDLSFCGRVRDAGFQIRVHTGLRFGHSKAMVISERDYMVAGGLNA